MANFPIFWQAGPHINELQVKNYQLLGPTPAFACFFLIQLEITKKKTQEHFYNNR